MRRLSKKLKESGCTEWLNDDGWGTGLRGIVSYDDAGSFDLDNDMLILTSQDDFYPKISKWRPRCNFQPMAHPPPPPTGPGAAQCLNQSWEWESGLWCDRPVGGTPGVDCVNNSYTRARGCRAACVVNTTQLPNAVEVHCSPEDCRNACCADPECESYTIDIGGNGGVPGCDSIRPCCWLFKGNVSHHDQSGAKLNGVASGFKRGPSQPQPIPPRRELPAPSWDPYLPALCGSTSGFGNTIETADGTLVTPSSYDNASLSTALWDSVGPSMDGIGDGCGASQVRVMRWRLPPPASDDGVFG